MEITKYLSLAFALISVCSCSLFAEKDGDDPPVFCESDSFVFGYWSSLEDTMYARPQEYGLISVGCENHKKYKFGAYSNEEDGDDYDVEGYRMYLDKCERYSDVGYDTVYYVMGTTGPSNGYHYFTEEIRDVGVSYSLDWGEGFSAGSELGELFTLYAISPLEYIRRGYTDRISCKGHPDEEIFGYLAKRRKMIEGVVLTGGEPTLQKDLLQYAERIRSLGLRTKLDTNGYRPDVLKEAVRKGLFDYVAMDIKNSVPRYGATVGIEGFDPAPVLESIAFLLEGHVDFEFRTTVMAELHDDDSFRDIAGLVEGAPRYFLQAYSDSGDIIDPVFSTPAQEDMERYLSILAPHVGQASIRDR